MSNQIYPGQYPPPGPQYPPPRRTHNVRNAVLGSVGSLVLLVIGIGIGAAATSGGTTTVTNSPAATDQAQPQPSAISSARPTPTAFKSQTLLDVSGSGNYTTQKFRAGGSGDYDVYWTYKAGSQGRANFEFEADNGSDMNLTGPNQLGSGSRGVTHVYNDAGTHYLQVNTEADSWTLKVVTAK